MEKETEDALRLMPYGIYLLTTGPAPRSGTVVSWVSQVSYSPPLLAVALRRNRKALPEIRKNGSFSLHLFQNKEKERVSQCKTHLHSGPAGDESFVASFECRLVSAVDAGDHVLCIGEIASASARAEGRALTTVDYGKTYLGES
ncbi:MAG TPA: flavin reductase family protein [Thermodesulfobacteriota bacterium]|nr:flavin reductase family protein [Thermodesulfobacteriota bacterium]